MIGYPTSIRKLWLSPNTLSAINASRGKNAKCETNNENKELENEKCFHSFIS